MQNLNNVVVSQWAGGFVIWNSSFTGAFIDEIYGDVREMDDTGN